MLGDGRAEVRPSFEVAKPSLEGRSVRGVFPGTRGAWRSAISARQRSSMPSRPSRTDHSDSHARWEPSSCHTCRPPPPPSLTSAGVGVWSSSRAGSHSGGFWRRVIIAWRAFASGNLLVGGSMSTSRGGFVDGASEAADAKPTIGRRSGEWLRGLCDSVKSSRLGAARGRCLWRGLDGAEILEEYSARRPVPMDEPKPSCSMGGRLPETVSGRLLHHDGSARRSGDSGEPGVTMLVPVAELKLW